MKIFRYIILLLLLSITDGQSYIEVPLDGLITDRKQEISGMTTYKDNLILLPENRNGYYFYIPFDEIMNTLRTGDKILPIQKTFTTRKLKETHRNC